MKQDEGSDLERAVREQKVARALEIALSRWRTRRAPALAEAIERLGERVPGAHPIVAQGVSGLSFAEVRARVESCAEVAADPRVARALAALLVKPPFTALGSRALWSSLLEQLGDKHADPRTLAVLRPIAAEYTRVFGATKMGEQMQRGVTRLVAALEKLFPEPLEDAVADRVLPLLAATPTAKPTTKKSEPDLLEAIFAAPDDDAPRLVYADFLLERSDPRGELLTLQFRRHRGEALTAADEKREKQLLTKHAKDWLGPLHGVTRKDDNVFARGFLERCVFQPRNPASLAASGHPSWATVRELRVENGGTNDSGENVLAHPAMRHLRVLLNCDGPLLEAIAPRTDFTIERLRMGWFGSRRRGYDRAVAFRALVDAKGLPRLTALELGHETQCTPAMIVELLESPIGARLQRLRVELYHSLPTMVAAVERLSRRPAIEVAAGTHVVNIGPASS
ncbi:MAG: TIGR02996 domain-containing protein [Polyangiales bacterium]